MKKPKQIIVTKRGKRQQQFRQVENAARRAFADGLFTYDDLVRALWLIRETRRNHQPPPAKLPYVGHPPQTVLGRMRSFFGRA